MRRAAEEWQDASGRKWYKIRRFVESEKKVVTVSDHLGKTAAVEDCMAARGYLALSDVFGGYSSAAGASGRSLAPAQHFASWRAFRWKLAGPSVGQHDEEPDQRCGSPGLGHWIGVVCRRDPWFFERRDCAGSRWSATQCGAHPTSLVAFAVGPGLVQSVPSGVGRLLGSDCRLSRPFSGCRRPTTTQHLLRCK